MTPDSRSSGSTRSEAQNDESRKLDLSLRRYQLLTPLFRVQEIAAYLMSQEKIQANETVLDDLKLVDKNADELQEMIDKGMSAGKAIPSRLDNVEDRFAQIEHNIRSKLTVMKGYGEMLQKQAASEFLDGFDEWFEKIVSETRALEDLLDKLVNFVSGRKSDSEPDASIIPVDLHHESQPTIRGRILIVDDDEGMRALLERQLKDQGHETESVTDGKSALRLLKLEPDRFDLVLLDLIMPQMHGYQVLRDMKQDKTLRTIPVLVVSGLSDQSQMVNCIEAGAEDYLKRPFNHVMLRARIQASLEKKRYRDEVDRAKKRYDVLLRDILPGPVVDMLAEQGSVPPQKHQNVAVLFADLVGFTTRCAQLDSPEEVVNDLQHLFIDWENIAGQLKVQKIKTIGDAFMAAAGVLEPVDNPVEACVECGLKMIEVTKSRGFGLRVGVAVGEVISAVLGKRQYLYDLWGDTVNTAARMESYGKSNHVNLTLEAWGRVVQLYNGRETWEIKHIKGKGPMQVLSVRPVKTQE